MSVIGYVFSMILLVVGLFYTEMDWSWMVGRLPSQADIYALSIWLLVMSVSWDAWRKHENH